jgi:hypothetical protein
VTHVRGIYALLAVTIAAGLVSRTIWIDRIPGINGDEAWYGVNVNELLTGGTPFLQTPSGNIVNPVHSLPLLLISLIAAPSFTVLRAPEVWWGVLTVVFAYPLLARPLGSRAAVLTTALLALSPTAIVYSRIGWDPSGAPFFSLLAVACALRDRPVLATLNIVIAYAVHPTTIFMLPFVAAAWVPHAQRRYATYPPQTRRRLHVAAVIAAVAAIPVGAVMVTTVARMGRLPSIEMVTERLTQPSVWAEVWLSALRLFSGVTATVYAAGPLPAAQAMAVDVIAGLVLTIAIAELIARRQESGPARLWLVAGLGGSVVMLHVIGGPIALEPGFERYAVSLVVPLVVVCAVGLDALARSAPRAAVVLTIALCTTYGAVVAGGYFHPLVARGGDAHPTFRTGVPEPKAAAYEFIREVSRDKSIVSVFAEDWWIYFPVRYLAIPDRQRIFVEMLGTTPPVYAPGAVRPAYPHGPDQVFAVVFHGSPAFNQVRDLGGIIFTAADPIGRPILHVIELKTDRPLPFADPPPWSRSN